MKMLGVLFILARASFALGFDANINCTNNFSGDPVLLEFSGNNLSIFNNGALSEAAQATSDITPPAHGYYTLFYAITELDGSTNLLLPAGARFTVLLNSDDSSFVQVRSTTSPLNLTCTGN